MLIVIGSVYWSSTPAVVSPENLARLIGESNAPALLDVRTSYEYDQGHLPGAIHSSVFTLFSEHGDLAISQQEPILVYCNVGIRSRVGAFILNVSGYESVYLLEGEIDRWRDEGYPLIIK